MKKSQLRKIIRESVKQLMVEQMSPLNVDAVNYSQTTGQQTLNFHLCEGETTAGGSQYTFPFNSYGAANGGCCSLNYSPPPFNGWYHGLGYGADITSSFGGFFWPIVQAIQSGNSTNGWYGTKAECLANCTDTSCQSTSTPCDQTPQSACAQQWFGNTAGNFAAWMLTKDCSNYQSVVNQLEPQAIAIMNDPNNTSNPQLGPYNNWNDIKNAANTAGLSNNPPPPVKSQFKRKTAKAMYAQCQIAACNC